MNKVVIVFLIVLVYRIVINLARWIKCNILMKDYLNWIKENNWQLVQKRNQVIEIWKKAGLVDKITPRTEPTGYGQLVNYRKSVFDSFPSSESDMFHACIWMFNEAIGIYRGRFLNTFNPFFWIEKFIFLPKTILESFHYKNKVVIKLLQGIYWLIGIISTFMLTIYPEEVKRIFESIINNRS